MASQSTGAGPDTGTGASATSPPGAQVSVEMENLDTKAAGTENGQGQGQGLLNDVSIPHTSPLSPEFPSTGESPSAESKDPVEQSSKDETPDAEVVATPIAATDAGPVLVITLLLPTGARHPYKIDEKYLTKRNVNVPDMTESGKKDPFSISVYTLKELILREWREEWETAPSSPSSIRLIYFGRLLDDKTALKECRFNTETANVVHMTVRPQEIVDEEEASKNKISSRNGEAGESTAGCRCVIL